MNISSYDSIKDESLTYIENLNENNIKSNERTKSNKSINLETKFNEKLKTYIDLYNKRKFRKLYIEITKNEMVYNKLNLTYSLCFSHLKIKIIIILIERKFQKYYNHEIIPGLTKWLERLEEEIEKLRLEIDKLHLKAQPIQNELVTYYYLVYFYSHAVYCKRTSNFGDCLSYLSLSERIITSLVKLITLPDTLNIIIKVYLFISSNLIIDEDYASAETYVFKAIHLIPKQINLIKRPLIQSIHGDNSLFSYMCKIDNYEILMNLGICFYHLGVCLEGEGLLMQIPLVYKQASWVVNTFFPNELGKLGVFLTNIYELSSKYLKLLEIFRHSKLFFYKPRKKEISRNKNRELFKLSSAERDRNTEKTIEKLKIPEIDDEEQDLFNHIGKRPKTFYVNNMTKNINLLNYLLHSNFTPVITNLNHLEINNLNKETKRIIQKRIINIKSNERAAIIERERKKNNTQKATYVLSKSNSTNKAHLKTTTKVSPPNTTNRKRVIQPLSFSSSSVYPTYTLSNEQHPRKIKFDGSAFRKSYHKKIDYLDKLITKEYQFQKNVLNNKKCEKFIYEEPEDEKIKKKAEYAYLSLLEERKKIIKQNTKTLKQNKIKDYYQKILYQTLRNQQNTACKSLVLRLNERYSTFIKDIIQKIEVNDDNEDITNKNDEKKDYEGKYKNINNNMLNQLNFELNNINQREKMLNKNFFAKNVA